MKPAETFGRRNQSPSTLNPSQLKLLAKSDASPDGCAIVYASVPTYCFCACARPIGTARKTRRQTADASGLAETRPILGGLEMGLILPPFSGTVTARRPC